MPGTLIQIQGSPLASSTGEPRPPGQSDEGFELLVEAAGWAAGAAGVDESLLVLVDPSELLDVVDSAAGLAAVAAFFDLPDSRESVL